MKGDVFRELVAGVLSFLPAYKHVVRHRMRGWDDNRAVYLPAVEKAGNKGKEGVRLWVIKRLAHGGPLPEELSKTLSMMRISCKLAIELGQDNIRMHPKRLLQIIERLEGI